MRRSESTAEGPCARVAPPVDFGLFAPEPPIAGARSVPLKFAQDGPLQSMVRRGDHQTSRAAALVVEPRLSDVQREVMAAFHARGNMHDERLERLPEFAHYAPSTIRKRRTELVALGLLRATKEKAPNERGSAVLTVWTVVR